MGQLRALTYKNFLKIRSHKVAYCCSVISPLLSLSVILFMKLIIDSVDIKALLKDQKNDQSNIGIGDSLIPTYMVGCNLINYNTWSTIHLIYDHYRIPNPFRIIRYGTSNEKGSESQELEEFFETTPMNFGYSVNYKDYPRFRFVDGATSNRKMNEVLIEDINFYPLRQPDASIFFDKVDWKSGFSANIQQMNPIRSEYMRINGYNVMGFRLSNMTSFTNYKIPSEGYISTMNMINNKYIQKVTKSEELPPTIVAIVSPTTDSSKILQFLDNGYAAISIILFPLSLSFGFPLILLNLIQDKEHKVKEILEINGLRGINYWTSYLIYYMMILTFANSLFFLFAYYFVQITFFLQTSFPAMIIYMLISNLSLISFAFLVSTMIQSVATSVFVGYIVAFFFVVASSGFSMFVLPMPQEMPWFLLFLPQTNIIRFFNAAFYGCLSDKCISSIWTLNSEMRRCISIGLFSIPVFLLVSVFLSEKKVRNWFIKCTRCCGSGIRKTSAAEDYEELVEKDLEALDYEKTAVLSDPSDSSAVILAKNLNMVYRTNLGAENHALRDFSMSLQPDEVFCLLGPNGAGKSTLLSILTRSLVPTSGKCWIEGKELEQISDYMVGFCPQFDIVLEELTVRENHKFYAMFKGLESGPSMEEAIDRVIESVRLTDKRDKFVGELSGGMRRRLSLGISMTGEPRILLLDEPSSGLDPFQRRVFWETIKRVSVGKAVMITTHLMDEAEVLGNNIGLIVGGSLSCYGSARELKAKYSPGMRVRVQWRKWQEGDRERRGEVLMAVRRAVGGTVVENEWDTCSEYWVESAVGSRGAADLFRVIEEERGRMVDDWSIVNKDLEEVFLKVVDRFGVKGKDLIEKEKDGIEDLRSKEFGGFEEEELRGKKEGNEMDSLEF